MRHLPSRPPAQLLAWGGLLLAAAAWVGCSSNSPSCLPGGACAPTVEGVSSQAFANAQEAVRAFSRASPDAAFNAVLEDVAWIRFEGDEETVLKRHRAYFEQGYTTFDVTLMTKEFTQPTGEAFLLTDSRGAHIMGKPITYNSSMGQENERFAARFQVSFRHAITREVDWVRLKRVADEAELEWVFPWAPKAPEAAQTTAPTHAASSGGAFARPTGFPPAVPENLLKPANAAPPPQLGAGGLPVNLLTTPSGAPGFPAPQTAPSSQAHIPSSASVGEPAWSEPPSQAAVLGSPPIPASTPALLPAPAPAPASLAAPPPPPAPSASQVPGSLPPPAVRRR